MLVVRLPEELPGPATSFSWIEKDAAGRVVGAGEHPNDSLPRSGRIELVAPAGRVLMTQALLPRRTRGRLRELLRFAVENRISGEPGTVHVALGPQLDGQTHAVAVVDRAWLTQWVDAFRQRGTAPLAMRVEWCLVPLEPGTWSVVRHGTGGYARTGIASGMALDEEVDGSPPAILRLALQEALVEGRAPARLVVFAEEERMPDLARWSAALGVTCEPGPAREWTAEIQGPDLDLLQGEFSPANTVREYLPRLRPALVLCAMIAALHVAGTAAHWVVLSRERSALRSEMHTLFRQAFPAASAIVDPPLQMRRKLAQMRRAAGQSQADDFVPLLAEAAARFDAGGVQGRITGASYERGRLLVEVQLGQRSDADVLLGRLRDGNVAAALEAVGPQGKGVVARFALSAKGRL